MEKARDQTIDIAKGIAIIAIVLGHVLRGLGSAGLVDSSSAAFMASDRALYMGHLTVFAFLSGLFVARGVEKDGSAGYLRGRLGTFLYLYLVWQTLQVIVKLGTASLVNSAPDTKALLEVWNPEGQMWFLPWLIIATSLAVFLRPWRETVSSWLGIAAVSVVSIAAWGYGGPHVGMQGLSLLIFFVVGARVRFQRLSANLAAMKATALGIAAVGAAAVYSGILLWTPAIPPTVNAAWSVGGVSFGIAASAAGLAGVLALSALASRLKSGVAWLAFAGKRSLEIFLAHIIAASGTRIVLEKLGIDDPALHIIAGLACGMIGPLLLWWLLSRVGFTWLFQRPAFIGRKPGTAQTSPPARADTAARQ